MTEQDQEHDNGVTREPVAALAKAIREREAENAYLAPLPVNRDTRARIHAFRAGWQEGVLRGWQAAQDCMSDATTNVPSDG